MMEQKLPYGAYLIEQFVEREYEPDAGGLGVALGEAMSKSSGKWYRLRWEAYEKHFDHVITELCIKPVYKDLETDEYKPPSYKVSASKEPRSMKVNISFQYDDRPDLNFLFIIDHFNLYDEIAFEHLSYQIYRHFKHARDDVVYGGIWNKLSHEAKALFLYEIGVFSEVPRFTPPSAADEIRSAKLMNGAFNPTDEGHMLVHWLLKTEQVSRSTG